MKGFYTLAGGMFISTGGLVVPRVALQGRLLRTIRRDKSIAESESGCPDAWVGSYTMSGGTLMTPYIKLDFNGTFEHTGGEILNNQRITMVSGKWEAKPGRTQLGQLELPETTRSPIRPCVQRCTFGFAPSANVAWQSGTTLQIKNWAGSFSGGETHQITFSPNGLTAQQVGQVRFEILLACRRELMLRECSPAAKLSLNQARLTPLLVPGRKRPVVLGQEPIGRSACFPGRVRIS